MNKNSKKERILYSALALFMEKGYLNTKIIDISMKSGIGKGTVYEYFQSKEEILLLALSQIIAKDFQEIRKDVMKEKGCYLQMKAYLSKHMRLMEKYGSNLPDLAQQISMPSGTKAEEIKQVLQNIIDLQYQIMADVLKQGQAAQEIYTENLSLATTIVMGAINQFITLKVQGQLNQWNLLLPHVSDTETWGEDQLIQMLMEGMNPHSPAEREKL
jgi:TetR/AcrR family fatty acid metabolism transcriptional regulator